MSQLTEELVALLQTEWTPERYQSWYDSAYCLSQNVSYSHRVDMEDNFNFCSKPLSGSDAFLFASLALLAASVCMGKLQSVWLLIIGGVLGVLNYEVNLYRLGNAIALWLGIQPPDLFFYAFLPPLLVDAALRLDWYLFSKLWPHIVLLAYGMVIINAAVLAPFILFVLGFTNRGWDWIHGAILAAMLAPTDAVAVTAILKAGGGPENMVVLMEGEALLNDASAVTLYTVFLGIMEHYPAGTPQPGVPSQIWPIIRDILKLTGIGCALGLAFAWALGYVLRLLRWRGARPYIESIVVLATAYLAFYVSQGPAGGSGVIAVCVFGLFGSATGHWRMLATDAESGIHEAVWDTVAFAANSFVFFWSGISSVNFVIRAASEMSKTAWNYAAIPIIFIFMYAFRGACLLAFNPLFKLLGTKLSLPDISFATVAGLRGSLTLIMAADFIIHSDFYTGGPIAEANYDVVLWASVFVLLSLLINAPSIGPVMRWTGLSHISPDKVRGRRRAVEELRRFTAMTMDDLRQQQDGEFLQGANWGLVATFVDHSKRLKGFVPKPRTGKAGKSGKKMVAAAEGQQAGDAAAAADPTGGLQGSGSGSGSGKAGSKLGVEARMGDMDMEVPFMPGHHGSSGLARSSLRVGRTSMDAAGHHAGHALDMTALLAAARGSHYGSFHAGGSSFRAVATAAAAAGAGAEGELAVVAAVAEGAGIGAGIGAGRGSFASSGGGRRTAALTATMPSTAAPSRAPAGTSVLLDGEEEEVELLFSNSAGVNLDFDKQWQASVQPSLDRASAAVAAEAAHKTAARRSADGGAGGGAAGIVEGAVAGEGAAQEDRWTAQELHAQMAATTATAATAAGDGQGGSGGSGGSGGGAATKAAAALVKRQITSVTASRAAAAGAGSNRDLLGRLQSAPRDGGVDPAAPSPAPAAKSPQQLVSTALLSRAPSKQVSQMLRAGGRPESAGAGAGAAVPAGDGADLEAGLSPPAGGSGTAAGGTAGASPKHSSESYKEAGSGSEDDGGEGSSLQEMRLRILHGLKRHFRTKRLAGLLSPAGLRIAIYACDKAIEHAEEHPQDPLQLWQVLNQEIRGTWATHAVAGTLARTLRLHRSMPGWWRKATALPFQLFTGLLRKHLGSKMLIACEASVELYMGLAASPQMQWVYYGEDAPVAVLEEVQGQLLAAYEFIQDREAEAPAQYRAVQSYRAAMAVLRQQRAFIADMTERGLVDEDEREALSGAVDAAMRHLDITGPIWRPPTPKQVVHSLDVFAGAPLELTDTLLQQAKLTEYKPESLVWSSDESDSGNGSSGSSGGGFYVVVSGVVRQDTITSEGGASEKLQGVGTIFGALAGLCGSRLPGTQLVTACGNSFGRGPLIYHFPASAVEALNERVEAGDEAAAALQLGLLRVAGLHTLEHVQADVQSAVNTFLERHRPLTKYAPGVAPQQQHPERVARYTAQVLLDMLHAIPGSTLVRLRPGDAVRQEAHMLLLQGSLDSSSAKDPVQAPAVLPWLSHNRFSFAAAVAAAQRRVKWQAGSRGATLLVCGGSGPAHSS